MTPLGRPVERRPLLLSVRDVYEDAAVGLLAVRYLSRRHFETTIRHTASEARAADATTPVVPRNPRANLSPGANDPWVPAETPQLG